MSKSITLCLTCFLLIGATSMAQDKFVSNEINFAKYLSANEQIDDQIYVLKTLLQNKLASTHQKDSIHYLLGGAFYQKQLLDSASFQYSEVSTALVQLHVPSIFWKNYLENHLGSTTFGRNTLINADFKTGLHTNLKNFQLAGNSLLTRNYEEFNNQINLLSGAHYQFAKQEKQLKSLYTALVDRKYKSPLIAGVMSTIIPGTGKMYAAKVGQGIATLIITTIMGIQTYEGYRKDGANSPRFIVYASLLSSFYVANIWGSVLSVNVRKREFDETINREILFNMHIPLRTIFN